MSKFTREEWKETTKAIEDIKKFGKTVNIMPSYEQKFYRYMTARVVELAEKLVIKSKLGEL